MPKQRVAKKNRAQTAQKAKQESKISAIKIRVKIKKATHKSKKQYKKAE